MSIESPLVSIIVPTYNRAHCLERALKSAQAQDYSNWEFIISDDGSTDETYELAQKLAMEEPRIVLLPRAESNQGAAVARNQAMEMARGKYLALLDSDDEWLPGKLRCQVATMENAGELVGICFTGAKIVKNGGPHFAYDIPQKKWEKDPLKFLISGLLPFTTSTTMLTKKCVEEVGLMSPELKRGQDIDYFLRVFLVGFGLLTIQNVFTVMNLETKKTQCLPKMLVKCRFFITHYYSSILKKRGKSFANLFAGHLEQEIVDVGFRELHWLTAFCAMIRSFRYSPTHAFCSLPRNLKSFCCGFYYVHK